MGFSADDIQAELDANVEHLTEVSAPLRHMLFVELWHHHAHSCVVYIQAVSSYKLRQGVEKHKRKEEAQRLAASAAAAVYEATEQAKPSIPG